MNEELHQNSIDNTADISKARRKRRWKYRLRKLLGILLLAAVLVGMAASLAVYFNVDVGTFRDNTIAGLRSGAGFPIDTQYVQVLSLCQMEGGVAVVSSSGADIYNASGALTGSFHGEYISPVAKTAGGRMLLYDLSGGSLLLANRANELFSYTAPQGIYAADLTEKGVFAYSEGGTGYLTVVTVRNALCEEMFSWSTGECYVNELAIEPGGKYMAAAGILPGGGAVSSTLRFLSFSREEQTAVELPGQVVLSMVWNADRQLQVLTDSGIYLFDSGGNRLFYKEHSGELQAFENSAVGGLYLAFGDPRGESGTTIEAYDATLTLMGSTSVRRKLISMEYGDGHLLILAEGQLLLADPALAQTSDRGVGYLFSVTPAGTYYYGISTAGLVREKL